MICDIRQSIVEDLRISDGSLDEQVREQVRHFTASHLLIKNVSEAWTQAGVGDEGETA